MTIRSNDFIYTTRKTSKVQTHHNTLPQSNDPPTERSSVRMTIHPDDHPIEPTSERPSHRHAVLRTIQRIYYRTVIRLTLKRSLQSKTVFIN
ncbi:hypothetical protein HanIR_Chr14g0685681 [Helianthus annuus]|nr:hypothetical protein HanIR_Chr14g0685681 [Helianthus annuus]